MQWVVVSGVCLSVRPSVRLSVVVIDQGHVLLLSDIVTYIHAARHLAILQSENYITLSYVLSFLDQSSHFSIITMWKASISAEDRYHGALVWFIHSLMFGSLCLLLLWSWTHVRTVGG